MPKPRKSEDPEQVIRLWVRMPLELRNRLDALAEEEERTLMAQIVWGLKQYLAQRDGPRKESQE